jgi:hypothetical protein
MKRKNSQVAMENICRERSSSNVNAGKRTGEGIAGERRGYSRSGTEVPEDDEH